MRLNDFVLVGLATLATARPHRQHGHAHPVRRQADVTTQYVAETVVDAVLYVDQNGVPVTTSLAPAETPTPSPVPVAAAGVDDDEAPAGDYPQAPPAYPSEDSSPEAPATTSSAPPPQYTPPQYTPEPGTGDEGDVENVGGYSIAYAGYNGDHSCKTKEQLDADIDGFKQDKYAMVRIYGTDCDQVPNIMAAAKRNDMKVFLGIWDVYNVAAEAALIIDGVQNDWDRIHTVSVGNELLNEGLTPLSAVISGINTARSVLREAGYSGPVTTVDVFNAIMMEENRPLCNAVDYIAANAHPFFSANTTAEESGKWVRDEAQKLSDWCDDKKDVLITETGWPSAGLANGAAVPGEENQRIAIKSIREAYVDNPNGLILFSAYNDDWKDDNQWQVEHYWGIYGNSPSAY